MQRFDVYEQTFRYIRRMFHVLKGRRIIYMIFMIVWSAQDFVVPYFIAAFQYTLLAAITHSRAALRDTEMPWIVAGIVAYIGVFSFCGYKMMSLQEYGVARLRESMARGILYAEGEPPEDSVTRFTNDAPFAFRQAMGTVGSFSMGLIAFAGSLSVITGVHWILGCIAVALGLLNIISTHLFVKPLKEAGGKIQDSTVAVNQGYTDNIACKIIVRLFSLAGTRQREFAAKLDGLALHSDHRVLIGIKKRFIDEIRRWLTYIGIIGVGSILVARQIINLPSLVLVLGLLEQVVVKMGFMIQVVASAQASLKAGERVTEVLDVPREELFSGSPVPNYYHTGELLLEMSDVSFTYANASAHAVHDINMHIHGGESIALVGPSGGGKSTLLKLIAGLIMPDRGKISLNGVDVRRASPASWRAKFAYVDQESTLKNASVLENLLVADKDASIGQVWSALQEARVNDFVESLPKQLDTQVGEMSSRISGGQRQRFALARSLLRRDGILVLDEATSALDPKTAGGIADLIIQNARNRTVIASTHDLTFASKFSRIYVVDGGTTVEYGTHERKR